MDAGQVEATYYGRTDFYEPCMDCEISLIWKYTSLSEHKDIKSQSLWKCHTVATECVYVSIRGKLEASVIRSMKFGIGKERRQQQWRP